MVFGARSALYHSANAEVDVVNDRPARTVAYALNLLTYPFMKSPFCRHAHAAIRATLGHSCRAPLRGDPFSLTPIDSGWFEAPHLSN
jgi:hypothetical protein